MFVYYYNQTLPCTFISFLPNLEYHVLVKILVMLFTITFYYAAISCIVDMDNTERLTQVSRVYNSYDRASSNRLVILLRMEYFV